ncbi:MAG TPA: hypothetical protein VMI72_06435 [Roseiarcus sp.]|nr:hypothetical protein [Roseiarcus sp.]
MTMTPPAPPFAPKTGHATRADAASRRRCSATLSGPTNGVAVTV